MAKIDDEKLEAQVMKYLDRAGHDQRLTCRILRKKVEEKLKLNEGDLDDQKEHIKDLIMKWAEIQRKKEKTEKRVSSSSSSSSSAGSSLAVAGDSESDEWYKQLIRLAKAAGKGPSFFKDLSDKDKQEKVTTLSARLREMGLKFSDPPTEKEIQKVQKATEQEKDLKGIDSSAIIETAEKRKRPAAEAGGGENGTSASGAGDASPAETKKKREKVIQYNSDEEEADF